MRQNVRARQYLKVPYRGVEAAVPTRRGPLGHDSLAAARRFLKADDDRPGGKEVGHRQRSSPDAYG